MEHQPSKHKYLAGLFTTATPALVSGAIQAVLFNPFDRALYVRVHHQRAHFLDWRNFERPFQGFGNAALYRTICSASYIFWQDSCRFFIREWAPWLEKEKAPIMNPIVIGLVAGVANGAALNNMQAVKFHMWSNDDNRGFIETAKRMWRTSGWKVFFAGIRVTVFRDAVFGLFYEVIRMYRPLLRCIEKCDAALSTAWMRVSATTAESSKATPQHHRSSLKRQVSVDSDRSRVQFMLNLLAACVACIASAPLNYARTLVYGSIGKPVRVTITGALTDLVAETAHRYRTGVASGTKGATVIGQRRFLFTAWKHLNARLNVGWGSIRVGLGMAVGQQVFALVKDAMEA